MALAVGDKVPAFELPDQTGRSVKFSELLGKGPIVLFFYPKDETPVCTREACSFRDAHDDLAKAGATVFGISGDSVESHAKFAAHHRLQYGLLADVGDRVRNDIFGVPRGLLGLKPGRATYVIDKDGVVRHKYQAHLEAQAHVDEAIATVKKLS
jgi:thioredoxin-dependent peroxiredoxin